jgi:hypothetical protein
MPVDVNTIAGGNVAIMQSEKGPIAVVLDAAGKAPIDSLQPSPDAPRYTSHFATCPGAGLHRKPKT